MVEVDHRKIPYAEFYKLVGELGGRILSREGAWPLSRYRVALPKKNARELQKIIGSAQRSEAEAQRAEPERS